MNIQLLCAHGTFVVMEHGGGDVILANRTIARSWETFTVTNRWGNDVSDINDGDIISLKRRKDNIEFFFHQNWIGKEIASKVGRSLTTVFKIKKMSGGGLIRSGDTIALGSETNWTDTPRGRVADFRGKPVYITADKTRSGNEIVCNRPPGRLLSWEKFTIFIT